MTLINISRHGMAVEVPVAEGFKRGEAQSFTLRDLDHAVEVRGRVRWVRSDWRDQGGLGSVKYIQVAGLVFEQILSNQPRGIWENLRPTFVEPDRAGIGEPESLRSPDASSSQDGAIHAAQASSPQAGGRAVTATRPEPPVLIEPKDGATVALPEVTVVCQIAIPEEVTSISINGIAARLEEERAAAEVPLGPGLNRIRALIWRDDGSYRTYVLGGVTRED